jgi:hypothetical protein
MDSIRSENVWGRGRLWSAARIGVPAGVIFGSIHFARTGSLGEAIFQGIFFAVFFGAVMAAILGKSWPRARDLDAADRVTVARVVLRGELIEDPRLAPDVIDYVGVVRRTQEREQHHRWVLWAFAGLTLAVALGNTFSGAVRSASVWWVLVAFWAVLLTWLPRRRARALATASRAEERARELLQQAPPT